MAAAQGVILPSFEEDSETIGSETTYLKRRSDMYNQLDGDLEGYDCQVCRNKGKVSKIIDGTEFLAECECLKVRSAQKKLQKYITDNGGELADISSKTFESFETDTPWRSAMVQKIKTFLDYYGKTRFDWLFVAGQQGSGKTHLCTAVCIELLKRGHAVRYVNWRQVVRQFEVNRFSEESVGLMNEMTSCEVLYVDDLLKQVDPNRFRSEVSLAFEIIDSRARFNKSTILSTEWMMDKLIEFDRALAGRINEHACKVQVAYDPERDWRFQHEEVI